MVRAQAQPTEEQARFLGEMAAEEGISLEERRRRALAPAGLTLPAVRNPP